MAINFSSSNLSNNASNTYRLDKFNGVDYTTTPTNVDETRAIDMSNYLPNGVSLSKNAAIKSLNKMKKEGVIKGFFPGEVKNLLLNETSNYYSDKQIFSQIVKNDPDYGNDGIIFIFVK